MRLCPEPFRWGTPTWGHGPYGSAAGNIYDYQSGGLFNQNQLIANFNLRLNTKLTLGGFYTLSYADADTSGNSAGLIMNPYDIQQNYGRAPFDVRNRRGDHRELEPAASVQPQPLRGGIIRITLQHHRGPGSVRDRRLQCPAGIGPSGHHV